MTNKEAVYNKLKELSQQVDGAKHCGITAKEIAEQLRLQRTIVSHLLNELNKDGLAVKINTRPVYFLDQKVYFARQQELELAAKYMTKNESTDLLKIGRNIFKELIGCNGSLRYSIEQCKAAVSYPPQGLPLLLVGHSGVGKSFLAKLVYCYAKAIGCIQERAPFIIFNCAEYANNPELLSGTLFGHCKGAYTGADSDRIGLLEEADGGFLFLDEIHRLPPEGQEKLFLFLDQGIFRRLGDSGRNRQATVRLMFATTEDPEDNFLQTFLRRIPLVVRIPTFQERPLKEKMELIYTFYKYEAVNIKKDVLISKQVVDVLINSTAGGNIGKLRNAIKLSCANAFNGFSDKKGTVIKINLNSLPKDILYGYDGILVNKMNFEDILVSCSDKNEFSYAVQESQKTQNLHEELAELIYLLDQGEIRREKFFSKSLLLFNELIDHVVFNEFDRTAVTVIFNSIQKIIEHSLVRMQANYGIKYYGNSIEVLTYLLVYFVEHSSPLEEEDIEDLIGKLSKQYCKEHKISLLIFESIEKNLDLSLSSLSLLYLMIYIRSINREANLDQANAIIIAHGYSTASSIASVANRLLENYIFEAIDMPFELSAAEISLKLHAYMKTIDSAKGIIILVDMGSLEMIYQPIMEEFYGDIVIINNISTQLALAVGARILNGQPLEQIAQDAISANVCRYNYIASQKKKPSAIITTCFTGIGIAQKIKTLLNNCFTNDEVKVIAYDYDRLKGNGKEDAIFRQYDIKLIIGTDDPKIERIPYISLEDLITKQGDVVLANALSQVVSSDVIDKINTEVIKSFTLYNVLNYLTILNPDKIIDQVEQVLYTLELGLGFKFPNNLKISLYIHMCCMIERLLIKNVTVKYEEEEGLGECSIQFANLVKKSFLTIEQFYKIDIPASEIKIVYMSIKKRVHNFQMPSS